jgi:TonB-dependent receptor
LTLEGWNGALSHLLDTLKSEKLDAARDIESDFLTQIKVGIRATERQKDDAGAGPQSAGGSDSVSTGAATNAVPAPTPLHYATGAVPASWFTSYNYKAFTAPTMLSGNYDAIMNAIYGPAGAAQADPDMWKTPFTSHVSETAEDAYVMANFATTLASHDITGNFGVHVLHVDTRSESPGLSEGNAYTRALPSLTARWDLGNGNYLKGGISQELSRPALNDLRADRTVSLGSGGLYSGGGGNPQLKPYEADAVDISYENYFHKDGLLAIHPYYKLISNYIGYDTETIRLPGISGPVTFTSPYNDAKSGNLEGLELTFQTPFFFIPGMDNFGIYSNGSMVRSNIHENSPMGNPFPMNGVAKETGTFDVYYSDGTWESRIGLKYHSTFTILYSWDGSGLTAIKPETTLDFSGSWNINKAASVRFQAGNLLDTPLRTYFYNNPSMSSRTDFYGRRFLMDFTYKY